MPYDDIRTFWRTAPVAATTIDFDTPRTAIDTPSSSGVSSAQLDDTPSATGISSPVWVDGDYRVAVAGQRVLDLTRLEFDLLAHLASHPLRVFSRDQLADRVWGYDAASGSRTVDVHITRLRRKLGVHRDAIETIRGVGYRFRPPRSAIGVSLRGTA
ncbi:MAG: winged helix family transcriptional regulator [Actinomycetota bacterium]|nr:MAG: winged helix family transcriptional regulator [Actinomycetota bacterium]